MSANHCRLIESLECYMEDVLECFELFVKKTLLVITIAAGALVAMGMYLMKNVHRNNSINNRNTTNALTGGSGSVPELQRLSGPGPDVFNESSSTSFPSDATENRYFNNKERKKGLEEKRRPGPGAFNESSLTSYQPDTKENRYYNKERKKGLEENKRPGPGAFNESSLTSFPPGTTENRYYNKEREKGLEEKKRLGPSAFDESSLTSFPPGTTENRYYNKERKKTLEENTQRKDGFSKGRKESYSKETFKKKGDNKEGYIKGRSENYSVDNKQYLKTNPNEGRTESVTEEHLKADIKEGYNYIGKGRKESLQADTKENYAKSSQVITDGDEITERVLEVSSKENLLVQTSSAATSATSPKKCKSCKTFSSKLVKCPSSLTKVSEKNLSPTSSRGSSCESLKSRILSRESAPTICSKPFPSQSQSAGLSSNLFVPACNRKSSICKPVPDCARPCTPTIPCRSRFSTGPPCSRICTRMGKATIPSLATCKTPCTPIKYNRMCPIKPCNIPKRCPSKPCAKIAEKNSCCSKCCDDDD